MGHKCSPTCPCARALVRHASGASNPAGDSKIDEHVKAAFPRAITNSDLVSRVSTALKPHGYGESTLLATALCCDEVSRQLEKDFAPVYGMNFSMGGLAGFAWGGVTSFGAMAAHIPDGGSCIVLYGPHVGVSSAGDVGTTERRGREKGGACCGSAVAAKGHVTSVFRGEAQAAKEASMDPIDQQQAYVNLLLQPYAEQLEKSPEPMVELPLSLYDAQKKLIERIVAAGCGNVAGEGKIAMVGGIQINTPPDESDYFLPLDFVVKDNKNNLVADLMWK
jgi:hypothetical protein